MARVDTDLARFLQTYQGPQIEGLPKYARLREAFIAAIEDGHFKPGQKLPAEADLARSTPFSLGTIQKALKELSNVGAVVRRQGHGTFVAEPRYQMDAPWHCRFVGNQENTFLPVFPKVVLRKGVADPGPWTRFLAPKGEAVLQIDRVIRIGDEFSVYSRYFANAQQFGDLLEKSDAELEKTNFKILLRREYNRPVTRVNQTVRLVTFPDTVCAALAVIEGTPGMMLEIVASSGLDSPIYFQELYVPANRRKLYISDSSDLPTFWI